MRTYGSVVLIDEEILEREEKINKEDKDDKPLAQKTGINLQQKQAIGQKAAELINEETLLFLMQAAQCYK